MKVPNVKSEQYERYWDEGQSSNKQVRWYKKGAYKRIFRKRFIRNYLKEAF